MQPPLHKKSYTMEIFGTQTKQHFVRDGFSRIAEQYDRFNDVATFFLHRYWKREVVKSIWVGRNGKILDLCCGTGDLCKLTKRKFPENQVVGLDFSQEMLDIAGKKNGNNGVELLQGDALKLPFDGEVFDVVTVGFGMRNLEDLQTGVEEVYRVLKSGGSFICLEMGKIQNRGLRKGFNFFFFRVLPIIGSFFSPKEEMFSYFPQSTINYPSQEDFMKILHQAGFQNVTYQNYIFGGVSLHVASKV